ncbi:hypothetical protein RN001_013351 [Aquatica leii]|uniref:Sodefrin-like factor n=1 Tax=Aquatica leii TaxID=1421715 RepID=A0AAN7S6Y9_9COLE|nr:hypothetical protein RN001_013351 [Aquatica leii]
MNLLTCLIFLSPLITVGNALKCHVCEAANDTICKKGNPHLREVDCGLEDTTFFWFCLYKVIYNKNFRRHKHVYSCERMGKPAIFKNLPQCQTQDYEDLVDCRVCLTNLCAFPNSSTLENSSYFLILTLFLFNMKKNVLFM